MNFLWSLTLWSRDVSKILAHISEVLTYFWVVSVDWIQSNFTRFCCRKGDVCKKREYDSSGICSALISSSKAWKTFQNKPLVTVSEICSCPGTLQPRTSRLKSHVRGFCDVDDLVRDESWCQHRIPTATSARALRSGITVEFLMSGCPQGPLKTVSATELFSECESGLMAGASLSSRAPEPARS